MNDNPYESISALMDNEADDLELRRVLKAMDEEEAKAASGAGESAPGDLKQAWQRYHLVSASLKHEVHSKPGVNLLDGIHRQLENDTALTRPNRLARYLGQGAIAAAVSMMVLYTSELVLVSDVDQTDAGATGYAVAENSMPRLNGELNPATNIRSTVDTGMDAADRERLRRVVSEELDQALQTREIPATFIPESR